MEILTEIRMLCEAAVSPYTLHELTAVSRSITDKYKRRSGRGERLVVEPVEAAVYAVVRMPATFGAVYSALYHTLECVPLPEKCSLLDVGAGTGAGAFAADSLITLLEVTCLEREPAMRRLGQDFTSRSSGALQNAEWIPSDLTNGIVQRGDIVLSSYVLNELSDSCREKVVQNLWEQTDHLLLIVEPGTPEAFSHLRRIRSQLQELGACIAAPCVSQQECPLGQDDWCHFTVRVRRSKLHKQLKEADVPYEDEKFSYLAAVRNPVSVKGARILRHPQIAKGNIRLNVCEGSRTEQVVVTRKEKDRFKTARKAECGDLLPEA